MIRDSTTSGVQVSNSYHQSCISSQNTTLDSLSATQSMTVAPLESINQLSIPNDILSQYTSPNFSLDEATLNKSPLDYMYHRQRRQISFDEAYPMHHNGSSPLMNIIDAVASSWTPHNQSLNYSINDDQLPNIDALRVSSNHGVDSEDQFDQNEQKSRRKALAKRSNHNKSKMFTCKQCDYACLSKDEFWVHQRSHIRPEKLLTCPSCSFITEYKHHLEYHLRNHLGSKPFQCIRCSYNCVNLSMLRSHMKSHVNPNLYKCNNCSHVSRTYTGILIHSERMQHSPTSDSLQLANDRKLVNLTEEESDRIDEAMNTAAENNKDTLLALELESIKANINAHLRCGVCDYCAPSRHAINSHLLLHAAEQSSKQSIVVNDESQHSSTVTSEEEPPKRKRKGIAQRRTSVFTSSFDYTSSCWMDDVCSTDSVINDHQYGKLFECDLCGILFRNFAMYCTHKMFHSPNNPFKCNQCGQVYGERVEFFVHVAQYAHKIKQ